MARIGTIAVLLLAWPSAASELLEATHVGNLARAEEILKSGAREGADRALRLTLIHQDQPDMAGLLYRYGVRPTKWIEGLIRDPALADVRPRLRALVRNRPKYVGRVASMFWHAGPTVGRELVAWLDEDASPAEIQVALYGLRRAAGSDASVLAVLAARDDAYATLGWNGHVNADVVRALVRGVRAGNGDAVRAVSILRWPKRPDDAIKPEIKLLRSALDLVKRDDPHYRAALMAMRSMKKRRIVPGLGDPRGRAARKKNRSLVVSDKAVRRGLAWLVAHQEEEGNWDADDFAKRTGRPGGGADAGGALNDVGVTGLALLALLAEGIDPHGTHPLSVHVKRGLRWLEQRQDDDGNFSHSQLRHLYGHALATQAMSEAALLYGHPEHELSVRRAVEYLDQARGGPGHWGYAPRTTGTPALTTFCMHALLLANLLGIEKARAMCVDADAWLAERADKDGVVGYEEPGGSVARFEWMHEKFPVEHSGALTAAAWFCRSMHTAGWTRPSSGSVPFKPPVWNEEKGTIDMMHWYWGALCVFHKGHAPYWRTWKTALRKEIVRHRQKDGSWDPAGAWGEEGGRVMSTALMVLTLQAPMRFAPRP
ncbi:MAG: hypothetical protein AAGD14_18700 [Planctomycetota bacterium]